jgi:uncharacterized protein YecE (DUF72 family)
MNKDNLHIGTCSWKYDSWQGLIYPNDKPYNYLQEYSRHYRAVEVDQWFWSLFKGDKVVLPELSVVKEYAASVPENFIFSIKVPNSITLTHHYRKGKNDPLIPNPHFLSIDLMRDFLERLMPIAKHIGPFNFQFEYLNKQKMPGALPQFIDLFGKFVEQLPVGYSYCLEIRNPNYFDKRYFAFLNSRNLHNVFLQGYYMPSIFEIYQKHREQIKDQVLIRLHGPDRQGIEERTRKDWSRIVSPKDSELELLADMLTDLQSRNVETFLFVNNHFEGSAPRTIVRVEEALKLRCAPLYRPKLNFFSETSQSSD